MRSLALASLLAGAAALAAQPNVRPRTDVSNTIGSIGSPSATAGGRVGAFPNGQQAWGITTTSCNVGQENVPWLRDMNVDHPSIGMWLYREYNGRFEQISEFKGVKHGFVSTNSPGCGNCPGGAGTSLVIGCTDTYGASLNYSNSWMAPPSEINPWTGIWNSVGSHFDRGFPVVAPPQNTDNSRSPINFPISDPGHRNLVWDAGLNVTGATFYVSAYYNVIGEPDARRENNFATQQVTTSYSSASQLWSFFNTGPHYQTPPVYRWSGATVNSASNGNDDGRFYVAHKVTGPTNGVYRYEYAIMNRDNNRQGGAVRIPICSSAQIFNELFRDTDQNSANNWTIARNGSELVFTAPTGNNLTWGNLFNFGFDSDASPATGNVQVTQANAGPGAAEVVVSSVGPLDVRNLSLGVGCGSPAPFLYANGPARIGNASFTLHVNNVAANSSNVFLLSFGTANLSLGGCTIYVDPAQFVGTLTTTANSGGMATLTIPIPNNPAFDGGSFAVQVAEVQAGGAFGGVADLSSGLKVKVGVLNPGCN